MGGTIMLKRILAVGAALALAACGSEPTDREVYTLYRTAIAGNDMIHVATFDVSNGQSYNQENCQIVADLMQGQPGVTVAYVCRPGRNIP